MSTRKLWTWILLLASFAFVLQLSTLVKAQDEEGQDQPSPQGQDQDQGQDPPGRVARLNFSQGSVSFRPAGEDDWVNAVPNRPLVTGDDLWTDENSRAEVHLGSTAIRLDAKTGITFLQLDDHTTQIRLAQGSLFVRVRHVDDDDAYEIDTPNLAFALLQPGSYRIDVSADGSQTVTTVWHGRGRVTGGGFSYTVVANQMATFTGSDHLDYDLEQIPDRDDFDSWAFERDDREDQADSANYVSREMTGYEDLDEYGNWSYVAGYGPCWHPRAVAVGWAPYRFGHWVWVGPWGWTWVEDEPWGFAPFHYGRWAYVNSGWFWVPGPVAVHPVWSPALVGFVGGGPGFHHAGGVGVGWFPLAPGEVYVPGYHVSRGYMNNVNVTNTNVSVTNVTNVYNTVIVNKSTTINHITYVNQHVNNGVTVVSRDAFVNARPVATNMERVDQREIAAAPVSRAVIAEPIRTSVMGAGRPASVRPPRAIISRPVVAVRTPPAPQQSIEQRQAAFGGHLSQEALVRPVGPTRPMQMRPRSGAQPAPQNGGFRSFARPGAQPSAQPGAQPEGNSQVKVQPNAQPRTYEAQGNPPAEGRVRQPEAHPKQFESPNPQALRPPQPIERPVPQPHPLVRPAPPVQQSEQHEQQQAQKFRQWQQQRPSAPPPQHQAQPRPAQPTQAQPRSEAPKPPKH
jgi:hypothetical protein